MALREDDLEFVVRLYTNPDVRRYLGGPVDEKRIRDDFPQLLRSIDNLTLWYWSVLARVDKSFMGLMTLGPHHDGHDVEISYLFLPAYWGMGFATEAVRVIIRYGLTELELPRIIAETQEANLASCRLLERVGMRWERSLNRFGAKQRIYTT